MLIKKLVVDDWESVKYYLETLKGHHHKINENQSEIKNLLHQLLRENAPLRTVTTPLGAWDNTPILTPIVAPLQSAAKVKL